MMERKINTSTVGKKIKTSKVARKLRNPLEARSKTRMLDANRNKRMPETRKKIRTSRTSVLLVREMVNSLEMRIAPPPSAFISGVGQVMDQESTTSRDLFEYRKMKANLRKMHTMKII